MGNEDREIPDNKLADNENLAIRADIRRLLYSVWVSWLLLLLLK